MDSGTIVAHIDSQQVAANRRRAELAQVSALLAELEQRAAVLRNEVLLDGADHVDTLAGLRLEAQQLRQRLDELQTEERLAPLEATDLQQRYAAARLAELQAEQAALATEYARLFDQAAPLLEKLARLQQRAQEISWRAETLRDEPLLVGRRGQRAAPFLPPIWLGPPVTDVRETIARVRSGRAARSVGSRY